MNLAPLTSTVRFSSGRIITYSSMTKQRYFALLALGISVTILGMLFWLVNHNSELLSPVTGDSNFSFLQILQSPQQEKKIVYGFLPYWNVDKVTLQPELTQLAYFSLTVQGDGNLRYSADGGSEPGYARLQSDSFLSIVQAAQTQGTGVELVIAQFNSDAITAFLNSETAQEKFFNSLDSVLLAYPFSGVNIDIEYNGTVTDDLRDNFVTFIQRLDEHLETNHPGTRLSIDVYGSAASKKLIWDLPRIAPKVDYVIMMAYDYHRRSSVVSGPVAPLFGADSTWDSDIIKHLNDLVTQVPAKKIILGIPFYGYEWRTTSRESGDATYPNSGSTASFSRVQELLSKKDELDLQEHWDESALSPYLTYVEDGEIFTIYYENSRSLSYKTDLVRQLDLAGIAIWALGYEGEYRELWDVIGNKL